MSEAAEPRTLSLWPAVWKLLRLRALILLSGLRRATTRGKIGAAFVALLLLLVLVFVFAVSLGLLRFLRSPRLAEVVPEVGSFLPSMPVLIMQSGFLLLLLTSFGVLLQALYLAGDMDFLLSAPVPIRAVFVSKLLQAILPNLALICLVAVPVLFGLGASGGYDLLYYPLVLLMLVALALAAAGLSSLVVMGVVRLFPARRVAEVLGAAGAAVSLLCSQSGQFARLNRVPGDQAAAALRLVARLDIGWSPLAWAGRGVVGIGEGRWPAGVGFSLLALGSAALVLGLALTTAERLYYSGWAGMQAKQRRKKAARPPGRTAALPLAGLGGRILPPAVGAIVIKDWTMLRRDLRHLSQLVTPLILGVVYAAMVIRSGEVPPPGTGEAPGWFMQALQSAMGLANIGISLFVGWTLLSRLGAMGFSQEGKSYWMLKSAPVSAGRQLAAKYLAAYLPALALSWGFLGALALVQRAASTLWFSLAAVALCLAAAAGILVAWGVSGARFDWEDPQRMIGARAGCLGVLSTGLAQLVALALFVIPQVGLAILGRPPLAGQLAGLALGGAFCLACALLPLRIVLGRVPGLGES